MRTFDDLIKQYHISKITFQRRMNLIPDFKKKYCKRGKYNKLLISDKGVSLINYEKHDSTSKNPHVRHGSSNNVITKQDLIECIHQLKGYLGLQEKEHNRFKVNHKYNPKYVSMLRRRNSSLEHSLLILGKDYAKLAHKQTSMLGKVHNYLVRTSSVKKVLAMMSFISVGTSIVINLISLKKMLRGDRK